MGTCRIKAGVSIAWLNREAFKCMLKWFVELRPGTLPGSPQCEGRINKWHEKLVMEFRELPSPPWKEIQRKGKQKRKKKNKLKTLLQHFIFTENVPGFQKSLISFPVSTRITTFLKTPAQMQRQMRCSDKAGNNLWSPAGRRSDPPALLSAQKTQHCYKNSAQMLNFSLSHGCSSLSMWRWTYPNQQSSEPSQCLAWYCRVSIIFFPYVSSLAISLSFGLIVMFFLL